VKRWIAFPTAFSRVPLQLGKSREIEGWRIISGPTESGVFLVEATVEAISVLKRIYHGYYSFMEDF
jgi:hypothetical protein